MDSCNSISKKWTEYTYKNHLSIGRKEQGVSTMNWHISRYRALITSIKPPPFINPLLSRLLVVIVTFHYLWTTC